MERNNDLFATDYKLLGACTVKRFEINTTNQDPIYMYPYRKSQKEREEIKMEVDKMMEAGIIRPSRSPYSFPVVMITKKDKPQRFCVDYRKLNKVTTLDGFPLPRIDDLLDKLKGAKYFTLLDLKPGYWQIVMSEESIPKTAFSTPDGHFEFLRMPFGLTNGPKEFSRIMNIVLGDLPFVIIFVDDITIFSQSFEEHLKHLEIVMARLREGNLMLNKEKCFWCLTSVKLLGHIVSAEGIEMDPAKIEAIMARKPPTNVKQLQEFLGMSGYTIENILKATRI